MNQERKNIMKKTSKILTAVVISALLTITNLNSTKVFAKSSTNLNVAVVDVQKVVESSPQISALKTSRKNDMESLVKFAEVARADVTKETNESKKKTLEESYNKELNIKKVNFDKEYSQKLLDIDKNITSLIDKKAKSLGYDLVLTKTSVLDGGTDITNEILKIVK